MDKEDVVHIHSGQLFNHKKNERTPFAATWTDLQKIILSAKCEVSQRKANSICYHLYVESFRMIQGNLFTEQK